MAQMIVEAIAIDEQSNHVVLLIDSQKVRFVPIWIRAAEATAIQIELANLKPPRPLSHDLLKNLIAACGSKLELVSVTDFRDTVYYATMVLKDTNNKIIEVGARPSDAIAVALRCGAPIFMRDWILEACGYPLQVTAADPDEVQHFQGLIKGIDLSGRSIEND